MEENKVETPIEEVETSENNEVEETPVVESDDPYASKTIEDYKALEKKNKELFERTKKAEEAAKKLKATPVETNKSNEPTLTRDEAILFAKGYTDEEVDLAVKLSKINGTTVLKATEDDVFKTKVSVRQKKERAEKASLPASGGSGVSKPDKPTGEMSRAEHEAYYKKVMGL